jgi:hypothetical protein
VALKTWQHRLNKEELITWVTASMKKLGSGSQKGVSIYTDIRTDCHSFLKLYSCPLE